MRSHPFAFCVVLLALWTASGASASTVQLRQTDSGWSLFRDDKPYFIQGAGGDASKQLLKECGGNSFRTWGADDIGDKLDEAQRLGLMVTVGIWLGHERHHFDYNDANKVADQYEMARQAILKYKDHPAVLMWAIGNEMEGYAKGDNAAIWMAVQAIATTAHKLDPNHPTMTVIAEVGGDRIKNINRLCPDIDIVGINSYGGGPSLAQRYRGAGGVKPFVITEFGPPGTWECAKNSWEAPLELTSTAKASAYRQTYEKSVLAEKGKLCLGSYVFAWGNKQEATATWYGLFLFDGTRLEPIDTMTELWTGRAPANHCPRVRAVSASGKDRAAPGDTVHITLDVADPENDPLTVKWVLSKDWAMYQTGGDVQAAPPIFPEAIIKGDASGADVRMPANGGGYWLYAFVYDGHGGAAVANIPLYVNAPEVAPPAKQATLPFVLYADGAKAPYIWSGWMGEFHAISIDEKCTANPHSGTTCMKLEFNASKGFGGVVWQDPVDDWGDAPGGYNLTGARKLTFWARGEQGGEVVAFKMGILGKDTKFHDSGSASLDDVTLTHEWTRYQIDLSGKNLSCIKTGFVWTLGAKGKPVTFYLDDVQYE